MIRFQCIHCGGKIAVPQRHMDRLAQCPECGGVTHPLAHHLVAPSARSAPSQPPAETAPSCSNCGMAFGKLQQPFEWNNQMVCGSCHRLLTLDAAPARPQEPTAGTVQAPPEQFLPPVRARRQPTEVSLAIRTAVLGLVITAIALYAIVTILQSVGYLAMWGGIAIAVIAAIYWIRKGVLALRRRNQLNP